MVKKRRSFAIGSLAFACSVASAIRGGQAQTRAKNSFADFAGEWEGYAGAAAARVSVSIKTDGQFIVRYLSGLKAWNTEKGQATLKDSSILLKFPDGEMSLLKQADGTLWGTYIYPTKSQGALSLARK